ncbi:hypothetical protein SASPL_154425 [Salvia splendens]|uniref:NADH dehydrogenase [ubiquinone] 1 alpha subcomplex subunit 12 n=2 Tax=Salvia splendens TaxID=180675 RepID=A0A8X8YZA1_SALSN|nr:hypothetical protein SASPL_154425 [Salvia splendens]
MAQLEARREQVKMNVALLKKEEEERKAREGKATKIGKSAGPDLKSFIQQFPTDSEGTKIDAKSDKAFEGSREKKEEPESSEPTGSGQSFRPGTWQPPM